MPSPRHVAVPLLACLEARKLAAAIGHRPRNLDRDDAGKMILSHSFYFQHHLSFSRKEKMESTYFGDGPAVWNLEFWR
jgi:hypothetical protein